MRSLFCDVRYVRKVFGIVSWVRISVRRRRMEVRARFRCCEVLSLRKRVIRSDDARRVGLADPGVWQIHAPVYENRLLSVSVSVCPIRLCERKQCDATSAARTARHCTLPSADRLPKKLIPLSPRLPVPPAPSVGYSCLPSASDWHVPFPECGKSHHRYPFSSKAYIRCAPRSKE